MKTLLFILLLLPAWATLAQVDSSTLEASEEEEICQFPDIEAVFPGGPGALFDFIHKNMDYSQVNLEEEIDTKIYLSFTVEKDGTITNVELVKGNNASLVEEAMRMVLSMPKWDPGIRNGKYVRTQMRLPIIIDLR